MPKLATLMFSPICAVFGVPVLSATVIVTLLGPTVPVAVPLSSPLGLKPRPAGRLPFVTANVYGTVPPTAVSG